MRQGRVGGGGGASATSGGFADHVVHPSVEDLGTFWSFEYVRGVLRTVRVGKQGKPCEFPQDSAPPYPRGWRCDWESFDSDSTGGIYFHFLNGVRIGEEEQTPETKSVAPGWGVAGVHLS